MPATLKIPNIKIPQIARWRISGVSDTKIADLIGMSVSGLARLLATPEYKEYETALLNGHLSEMDKALAGKVDEIRHGFRILVPAAMRCLVDAVTQRRDMKTAFAAASEILDRDPDRTLPKQKALDEDREIPVIPAEILDAAVKQGNEIATSLQKDAKERFN